GGPVGVLGGDAVAEDLERLAADLGDPRHRDPELLGGEPLRRGLDGPARPAQRARRPVDLADGVEDGAPDPLGGVGSERYALLRLVAVGGLDETEHPGPEELFL